MDVAKCDDVEKYLSNFVEEGNNTIKLIGVFRSKAEKYLEKANKIRDAGLRQNVKNKTIVELIKLTETLAALNNDLQKSFPDFPTFKITHITHGDNISHSLTFLSGDNPWNFWLFNSTVNTEEILKNLLKKFQSGILDAIETPQEAQSVCFIERNKVIRGVITQIINDNRIKLVDCDTGVTKIVGKDKLYEIDQEACSVHAAALRCTITEEPDAVDLWKNSDLRDLFCNVLREATLQVKVLKQIPGNFPTFVVDIQLQNEDYCTASVKEWILDRLLPELKKLNSPDNDSIFEFLSEESLCPYKKILNCETMKHEVLLSASEPNDQIKGLGSDKELNNLNQPNDKLSNGFEEKNYTLQEKVSPILDQSSKKSVTGSQKFPEKPQAKDESRLNNSSNVLSPKLSKKNSPKCNNEERNYASLSNGGFVTPPDLPEPWPYTAGALQPQAQAQGYQWTGGQQAALATGSDYKVNAMAPEFVPRNKVFQEAKPAQNQNPIEHVNIRKPATLTKENETFSVFISHAESPSEFYVQFINKNNSYLDKLENDMEKYYAKPKKIEFRTWQEAKSMMGKFCACHHGSWYRVEVLEWCSENNLVKVWSVDYGNTFCVPLSCLQPLPREFTKLSMVCQACHLAKVHPTNKGQPWSEKSINFFKLKLHKFLGSGTTAMIQVVQSLNKNMSSLSVVLYDEQGMSINDMLVDNGLAWSRKILDSELQSNDMLVDNGLAGSRKTLDSELQSNDMLVDNGLAWSRRILDSELQSNSGSFLSVEDNALLEDFDPLKEDFESVRNNPAWPDDDACIAVSGYSARDEKRICKFYGKSEKCYKVNCDKEHILLNPDGVTTDREESGVRPFSSMNLPKPGEIVTLKITCVSDINMFYAQLEQHRGISVNEDNIDDPETLESLVEFMNTPSNISRMKLLASPPSPGSLVLAKEPNTGIWHRARTVEDSDSDDICSPLEVMFVDYGFIHSVSPTNLRQIESRYLHLPFQAIECSLANIEPLENELKEDSLDFLKELLFDKVFTAKIYRSEMNDGVARLGVFLQFDNGNDVGDYLVENNVCLPALLLD